MWEEKIRKECQKTPYEMTKLGKQTQEARGWEGRKKGQKEGRKEGAKEARKGARKDGGKRKDGFVLPKHEPDGSSATCSGCRLRARPLQCGAQRRRMGKAMVGHPISGSAAGGCPLGRPEPAAPQLPDRVLDVGEDARPSQ